MADPALAARLLRLDERTLLEGRGGASPVAAGRTALGRLFESLATLCVKPCAQAAEAATYHLREKHGRHEVDLVVEGTGGRVAAFEVKLAATPSPQEGASLRWLRGRIGDRLAAAVIITTGRAAYRRPDGIAVVPLALLGP